MLVSSTVGSTEILQIADAVSREKNIDKNVILEAMEGSVTIAARKKYGQDRSIRSFIDRKTGEINLFREFEVVPDDYRGDVEEDEGENENIATASSESSDELEEFSLPDDKIYLKDAKLKKSDANVGDLIREDLPPIDLGRVAAQTAKQVIVQKVRDAERERQYEDFKPRVGEIVNGTVKRVEFGNVIVDLGNAEAILKRNSSIRGETFKVNDRLRAYLEDVSRERKGPQIFLSRSAPEFMAKLFTQEVPEIYDGIIEIKAVSREAGSRAKIAVSSNDSGIDPVGSCVGVRGARVQAVIAELQGEKIDIVQWSPEPAKFLVNALAPAEVSKVIIDEDKKRIEAVIPDDQLSLAIGRRGQNVRLASDLVGWRIDVITEENEANKRVEEFNKASSLFAEALNIEEIIAHLLVTEGFSTIEEIAFEEIEELAAIEGFDEDIAKELQGRANEYLELKKKDAKSALDNLNIAKDLQEFKELSDDIKVVLGEKGVSSLDDFADLSRDEFLEMVPNSNLEDKEIDKIIMAARSHWFEQDEKEK